MGRPAVFLDRDGVINIDTGYVGRWEDFVFANGAPGALARLSAAGYLLVVVTNQSGIARGLYGEDDFAALTAAMTDAVAQAGGAIARVMHCPHLPIGQQTGTPCTCRKPQPGMILDAARDLDIDLARSILIGDSPGDIEAGRAAGVARCFLVGAKQADGAAAPEGRFASLADCVDRLLA